MGADLEQHGHHARVAAVAGDVGPVGLVDAGDGVGVVRLVLGVPGQVGDHEGDEIPEDLFLRPVVVVERPGRHAGRLDDVGEAGVMEAVALEDEARRVEQLLARAGAATGRARVVGAGYGGR